MRMKYVFYGGKYNNGEEKGIYIRLHIYVFRSITYIYTTCLLFQILELSLPRGRLEGGVPVLYRALPLGLCGINLGLPGLVRVV